MSRIICSAGEAAGVRVTPVASPVYRFSIEGGTGLFVQFDDDDDDLPDEQPSEWAPDIFKSVALWDPPGRFPTPFDHQRRVSEGLALRSGRPRKPKLTVGLPDG